MGTEKDDHPGKGKSAAPDTENSCTPPSWQVETCRGREGGCRFALEELHDLAAQISDVVRASAWLKTFSEDQDPLLSHHRLKIALAACPNACSQPQIKDVGLIAVRFPSDVTDDCTGCGSCEEICREDAIHIQDGIAVLDLGRCLGCGQCFEGCPEKAILSREPAFRIMVGGRVGRHPRWATELSQQVPKKDASQALARLLAFILPKRSGNQRISDIVKGFSLQLLREVLKGSSEVDQEPPAS